MIRRAEVQDINTNRVTFHRSGKQSTALLLDSLRHEGKARTDRQHRSQGTSEARAPWARRAWGWSDGAGPGPRGRLALVAGCGVRALLGRSAGRASSQRLHLSVPRRARRARHGLRLRGRLRSPRQNPTAAASGRDRGSGNADRRAHDRDRVGQHGSLRQAPQFSAALEPAGYTGSRWRSIQYPHGTKSHAPRPNHASARELGGGGLVRLAA